MKTQNTPSYSDDIYNPIVEIEDLYEGNLHDEEYDLLVFIGRMQPFHLGHKRVIDIALKKSKKVLVLIGSAYRPRHPRNPWTWTERRDMIRNSFTHVPTSKLLIQPLEDFTYRDELWLAQVQNIVKEVVETKFGNVSRNRKIGLIGCSKDSSSYYLKLFPQWGNVNVRFLNPLNATDIRNAYFGVDTDILLNDSKWSYLKNRVDPAVLDFLKEFEKHSEYDQIQGYIAASVESKQRRQRHAEFPIQDICADALVTQSGHVLVIRRGGKIGNGLLAMPGGYVNPDETLLSAAIRELREETRLKVPEPVLRGSIATTFDADHPHRSDRGRIYSKVFHFKLNDQTYLPDVRGPLANNFPEVEGADDADAAFWLPFSEIKSELFLEDHFDVISKILGL